MGKMTLNCLAALAVLAIASPAFAFSDGFRLARSTANQ